jgi:hypothetical protein
MMCLTEISRFITECGLIKLRREDNEKYSHWIHKRAGTLCWEEGTCHTTGREKASATPSRARTAHRVPAGAAGPPAPNTLSITFEIVS